MSLKHALGAPEILVVPGIYDALGARLVKQAGFQAAYLSGASLSYTRFGTPDVGLVTMSEVAEAVSNIRERADIPLLVDADTGYGNALNVMRTFRLLERNGANVIQLEDQTMPKRCGHLTGKTVVSAEEMAGKLKAAADARQNEDTLIMARTDAIAVEGLDAALDRAEKYLAAGADILFIEAPRSVGNMRTITAQFKGRAPLLANMVEGGLTPNLPAAELQEIGYQLAIFPGALVRCFAHAALHYLDHLKSNGSTLAYRNAMFDFNGLNQLLGTPELLEQGRQYDARAIAEENTNDSA